jgi:hypothetical protein
MSQVVEERHMIALLSEVIQHLYKLLQNPKSK